MILSYREYEIDEDRSRLDFALVHGWLSQTYWHTDLTQETVEKTAKHSSLVVGCYRDGVQTGYLRVVSDTVRFAYLADVIVDEAYRGKGIGRAMVKYALEHPDYATVSRWMLATRDAHGVYEGFGFKPLEKPESWMIYVPNLGKQNF